MIRTEAGIMSSSRFNVEGSPTDTKFTFFNPFGSIDEDLTVQGDLKGDFETSSPKQDKNIQSYVEKK